MVDLSTAGSTPVTLFTVNCLEKSKDIEYLKAQNGPIKKAKDGSFKISFAKVF